MKKLLFTSQNLPLTAKPELKNGNESKFADGTVPNWSLSDPNGTGASLQPAADGLTCLLVSGTPGKLVVTVTGEGDPTPGVDTLSQSLEIDVVEPEASQVVIVAGDAVDKA